MFANSGIYSVCVDSCAYVFLSAVFVPLYVFFCLSDETKCGVFVADFVRIKTRLNDLVSKFKMFRLCNR